MFLPGGGYVISPLNQGKQSVVKHMLAIDWKYWRTYLQRTSAQSTTIKMLGRVAGEPQLFLSTLHVCIFCAMDLGLNWKNWCFFPFAALRELFQVKLGDCPSFDFTSGELPRNIRLQQHEANGLARDCKTKEDAADELEKAASDHGSLISLNDAADEFFDIPDPSECDQSDSCWSYDFGQEIPTQVQLIRKSVGSHYPLFLFLSFSL